MQQAGDLNHLTTQLPKVSAKRIYPLVVLSFSLGFSPLLPFSYFSPCMSGLVVLVKKSLAFLIRCSIMLQVQLLPSVEE